MSETLHVTDFFGCDVFNEATMRQRLPKETFKAIKRIISYGEEFKPEVAEVVANAMKDWAIEKGATHFTHWFQPMTGITAEKHDSFISPTGDGRVIMEFSGKELVKGEPDASSFPSGGLRNTFEARGYTAWDPTSYAFYKDGSLYIPSTFCSYSGEVLDKKAPLLRSVECVSRQAMRILRLFGNKTSRSVMPTLGCEQEYFLIDKQLYDKRMDLIFTGRTLFGAKPPKGQELEDHYFGSIKQRVSDYMKDLDNALWRLGICSKTKHNEVAPAQHEMAPIFASVNIATDQNQLTMEVMKKTALKHGLVCLLHEKPFEGINGSGKHNNWSLSTNDGVNLFDPGNSPMENAQFLTFLAAMLKSVDDYADLLRLSVATAGNDHRLGGDEAPPAVVSVFLGKELTDIIEAVVTDGTFVSSHNQFDVGVTTMPKFPMDTTDRNRTSPFAFTGNKFEFRMPGSNINTAGPNIVINTMVADTLEQFADKLESVPAEKLNDALKQLLKRVFSTHKRIIFNDNGYDSEWPQIAANSGLSNLRTSVEALPRFRDQKNVELFTKHKVFTAIEMYTRTDIFLESYNKTINIEAQTAVTMLRREILPSVMLYSGEICNIVAKKKSAGIPAKAETALAIKLDELTAKLSEQTESVENALASAHSYTSLEEAALHYRDEVLAAMNDARTTADELETIVSEKYWPFPTYADLLFNV